MGPITPVNVGSAGPSTSLTPMPGRSINGPQQDLVAAGTQGRSSPVPVSSDSAAIMNVASAVSQLLQSIGGGLEDDKVLRMMIALIILLALLQDSQADVASTSDAFRGLGGGSSSSQSQYCGEFSSSTTIAVYHTSTTIAVAGVDSLSAFSDVEQVQTRGGEIDTSA